ncbi:MAG TPA: CDP-alcohol phosphatidyltransferase family protein [Dehalococcoidia bacterium]|nr:CDP-alcohol phosphatidyltransferase family protein [Dehalococcoidia bacterium]
MPSLLPRSVPRTITDPLVHFLARLGLSPNHLTIVGGLGNIGTAVLAGRGQFLAAGLLLLGASALDLLDGALARATGRASRFGSILDATVDRISEGAVLFGLIVWFSGRGQREEVLLAAAAIIGSFLVSYVRARSEIVGLVLREGLFTRAERVFVLGLGLIIDQVTIALWVLAVVANLTAGQRLWLAWRGTQRP